MLEKPQKAFGLIAMTNQPMKPTPVYVLIPDGQERLATQRERDDVNGTIVSRALQKQPAAQSNKSADGADAREGGDQVNRFLLCALVKESSRHIKASAEKTGEFLPMSMIVRGVLKSYRLAAMDKCGPLAGSELDVAGLTRLNQQVLKDEIARYSRDGVKNNEAKVNRGKQPADDARVKLERVGLERAIELRDQFDKATH